MNACNLDNLSAWLEVEAASIPDGAHRRVLLDVGSNLASFVKWPRRAELLWEGCDRKREVVQKQRYHTYPKELKEALPSHQFIDRRSNGPAIIAFRVAGGDRPIRSNGRGWNIHHLYDGKFPYPDNLSPSLRAVNEAHHFTQSAGLVAIHPVADALADEFSLFAWRLRAESYLLFGYDPEGAFAETARDEYGFAGPTCQKVWYSAHIDSGPQARA